ncbi:MAG: histidine triad nucleotide-binding protein [Dehalococcoidia bacterium]|nr:histidine triad nucleotide-binding protein [Dehalococcoidia bacterium]
MEEQCLFCRIIAGKIPASIVYQDDDVVAIRDIDPQAPTHLLVMPKEHIVSLIELGPEQRELTANLIYVANELARREGVAERGYRLAVNCGREGGQAVGHLHFHLLGGRKMSGKLG